MNAVVKRVVSDKLFIRLVPGFTMQHIDSTIDEIYLTKLYAKKRKVIEAGVPIPLARSSSDAAKKCENTLKGKIRHSEGLRGTDAHREGPDH